MCVSTRTCSMLKEYFIRELPNVLLYQNDKNVGGTGKHDRLISVVCKTEKHTRQNVTFYVVQVTESAKVTFHKLMAELEGIVWIKIPFQVDRCQKHMFRIELSCHGSALQRVIGKFQILEFMVTPDFVPGAKGKDSITTRLRKFAPEKTASAPHRWDRLVLQHCC